jgi:hypothetical protein
MLKHAQSIRFRSHAFFRFSLAHIGTGLARFFSQSLTRASLKTLSFSVVQVASHEFEGRIAGPESRPYL